MGTTIEKLKQSLDSYQDHYRDLTNQMAQTQGKITEVQKIIGNLKSIIEEDE